jgi:hypothetical protein
MVIDMAKQVKVGDKVRLLHDIRDAYQEIYLSEGDVVRITKIHTEYKGYEYCIPYGFCIGRDEFVRLTNQRIKALY